MARRVDAVESGDSSRERNEAKGDEGRPEGEVIFARPHRPKRSRVLMSIQRSQPTDCDKSLGLPLLPWGLPPGVGKSSRVGHIHSHCLAEGIQGRALREEGDSGSPSNREDIERTDSWRPWRESRRQTHRGHEEFGLALGALSPMLRAGDRGGGSSIQGDRETMKIGRPLVGPVLRGLVCNSTGIRSYLACQPLPALRPWPPSQRGMSDPAAPSTPWDGSLPAWAKVWTTNQTMREKRAISPGGLPDA